MSDGVCDDGGNTEACGFDGVACILSIFYPLCDIDAQWRVGDGVHICDRGLYNTEQCGWDGGDCIDFNNYYPNCTVYYVPFLGNDYSEGGKCNVDGMVEIAMLSTPNTTDRRAEILVTETAMAVVFTTRLSVALIRTTDGLCPEFLADKQTHSIQAQYPRSIQSNQMVNDRSNDARSTINEQKEHFQK